MRQNSWNTLTVCFYIWASREPYIPIFLSETWDFSPLGDFLPTHCSLLKLSKSCSFGMLSAELSPSGAKGKACSKLLPRPNSDSDFKEQINIDFGMLAYDKPRNFPRPYNIAISKSTRFTNVSALFNRSTFYCEFQIGFLEWQVSTTDLSISSPSPLYPAQTDTKLY